MTHPDEIVQFLTDNPGSSRSKVAAYLGMTPTAATKALSRLVAAGRVTMAGRKRGARYSVSGRCGETYSVAREWGGGHAA